MKSLQAVDMLRSLTKRYVQWLLVAAACVTTRATGDDVNSTSLLELENVHEDIVGGTRAPSIAYPFYGISKKGALCGATLIHTDIAVTAGHCAGVFTLAGLWIGGVELNGQDAIEDVVVLQEYRHPNFNTKTLENDIMLLKLQRTKSTGRVTVVQPVSSINTNSLIPASGSTVTTIGFGVTAENGALAENLQQVSISVLDSTTCKALYGWRPWDKHTVSNSMLCAADAGKDACQGDSGGPLLRKKRNGSWMLVGIVSWGVGCARVNNPGVYTRVSSFANFIQSGICALSSYKPTSC